MRYVFGDGEGVVQRSFIVQDVGAVCAHEVKGGTKGSIVQCRSWGDRGEIEDGTATRVCCGRAVCVNQSSFRREF